MSASLNIAMHRNTQNHLSFSGAVAILLSLGVVSLSILLYDATWPVRVGAGLVTLYCFFSLLAHPRYPVRTDPFSLFVVCKVIMLVGLVFSCLYVSTSTQLQNENLLLTILALTLSTLLITDALVYLVPHFGSNASNYYSSVSTFRVFLILWGTGWMWRLYAITHGLLYGTFIGTKLAVSSTSNLLGTLNNVSGLALWGCAVFSPRPLRVLPLAALEILWFLGTGSKGAIIYILIPFLMILYQRRLIRVGAKFSLLALTIILFSLLTFVYVRGYRIAAVTQVSVYGYDSFNAWDAAKDVDVSIDDLRLLGNAVAERLNYADRINLLLDRQEEEPSPLWYGKSYLTALVWFVPRAIWPDKPTMSLGRWFATEYLGWNEESRSETGITVWGEAYLNFGIVGAMIIPGIWIALLHLIYRLAISRGPWGLVFIASSYLALANSLAANFAPTLASIGQTILLIVLVRMLIGVLSILGSAGYERSHD